MLRELRKAFVRCKIYLDRTRVYMGYAGFVMTVFLVVDKLKTYDVLKDIIPNSLLGVIMIGIGSIGISILLGFLEIKLGVMSEESKRLCDYYPTYTEMINRLKDIQETLKKHDIK